MSSELLCTKCKHSFRKLSQLPIWGGGYEWLCRKAFVPEHIEDNPVIGPQKTAAHYKRCTLVRLHPHEYNKECGKEGVWWEPKNKKYLFLQIKHSHRL